MRIVTFPDGVQVDADTGEVVGRGEPAKITAPGAGASPRSALNIIEEDKSLGKTAMDALQQFSWGFNSALFSLPDTVVEQVGKAAGVRPDELPTFTRYFNTGQVAPENMLERFANTIGKGSGAGMTFTGILGGFARTNALRAPLTADAGVLKRVAKDTLDYIRKDPKGAVLADTVFGGIYGALEQGVEEAMEEGTAKEFAKATVPMAGILAVPAVLSMAGKLVSLSPTVRAGKAAAQQFRDPQDILVQDVMQDDVLNQMMRQNAPKIPGLGFVINKTQRLMANRAANQMRALSEELADPTRTDVQQAMKSYNDLVNFMKTDPLMQQIDASERFLLDAAQVSLYGPLLAERNKLVRELTGPALRREQLRQQNLEKLFAEAFDVMAPRAPLQFDDALRIYWADDQNSVAQAMKQIKDLSETEALSIADRFKAIDLNDIGDTLRRSVIAQMDGQFYKLQKELNNFQFGAATRLDPEGVPLAVREGLGYTTPGIPAADFEEFANNLVKRFAIPGNARLFAQTGTPRPVQQISRILANFEKAKTADIPKVVREIIEERFATQYPQLANMMDDPVIKQRNDNLVNFIVGKDKEYKNPFEDSLRNLSQRGKPTDSQKSTFYSGIAKTFGINAKDLDSFLSPPEIKNAKNIIDLARADIDREMGDLKLTMPEAIDLLGSSMRNKNSAFLQYNKMIENGTPRNFAQRYLDVSNALHRDIEDFVLKSAKYIPDPVIRLQVESWFNRYKSMFNDGYEKYFPMLLSKRRTTGEPYISSESVISEALKSGDNIRALNLIMGQDNPMYKKALTDVMYDQAYRAGVVGKDGLVDTAKYNRWLATKQNIINAMPDSVQATLRDEATAAENVMQRLRDMQSRVDDSRDLDFDALIKRAVRPGADTNQLIATAISDPASMKLLIDRFGKTPQNLESLRRRVWDQVRGDLYNPENPTYLKDFLQKHGKSLNMIYEPQHLDNLRHLAEIQQRIFLGERVVGKETPFLSADEKLRKMIGSGFGTLESTVRAATIRIISPVHAGVSLLARLISRQQHNVYEAIMYKALTDPKYAQALANSTASINTRQGDVQMGKLLADAGYPLSTILRPAIKIAGIEAVQATMPEEQELPVRQAPLPAMPAPRPSVQAPAAPSAARPLSQSPVARTVPPLPQPQNVQGTYEQFSRLFPNDFVSPMIEQRAQPPQP